MDTLESAPTRVKRDPYADIDIHGRSPAWPAAALPPLTGPEAIAAAKRLWRKAMGKAWSGKWALTSGNRYSRPRHGVFYINPDRGWKGLVHSLSHIAYRRLSTRGQKWYFGRSDIASPKRRADFATARRKPHTDDHALLEREMIAMVVQGGWLDGKLRSEPRAAPTKEDKLAGEHARILARIKTWETKAKRAATALAKLRRQEKSLRRRQYKTIEFSLAA